MRPAFRIVPAALAAFVVALAFATATSARHAPPHPRKAHAVSATVPYVAPWQTGFEKFATQVFVPTLASSNILQMVIPDGQWWRIIYLNVQLSTSAVAGNRGLSARVTDPQGTVVLFANAAMLQPASALGTYLFGPQLTSFANTTDVASESATTALPDVLWPQGDTISLNLAGIKAGDAFSSAPRAFAVEIYTEDRPGVLTPKLTPTPLIP